MTHASDLARLAETFIDRYLVECDARREAEAALVKSEEERATQSANLAAAMAECADLRKRVETEAQSNAAVEANYFANYEREKARAEEAETRANYWAEQFNKQSSRRIAAESERDALRRAEAGRGVGDGLTRSLVAVAKYHAEHAAHGGASFEFHARAQTAATDAADRLAALQAKADALTVERDEAREKAAQLRRDVVDSAAQREAAERAFADYVASNGPAEAKAAGEGRVVAFDAEATYLFGFDDGFLAVAVGRKPLSEARAMYVERRRADGFLPPRTLAQPADAGQPTSPTSPAKPSDRYVVVERNEVKGRPAEWYLNKRAALLNVADYNDGTYDRANGPGEFDPLAMPDYPDCSWAIVDTQPDTAPQPSPRAVGVDAERLADLPTVKP